jgi:hypothetical protein
MSEILDNIDDFMSSLDEDSVPVNKDTKEYQSDLYKKWFRSKSQSGFLAIRPWYEALKFKIDIGKTSPDGKLLSSTNVFVDAIDFGAYLKSIVSGTAQNNYPSNAKMGVPTPEGFVSYGGAVVDNKPVSRIFKAHHWQSNDEYDPNSFVWKCGHFAARKSDSGAFIPDMKQLISADMIKVTRQDVCSISYIVDMAISSYVANNTDWYEK